MRQVTTAYWLDDKGSSMSTTIISVERVNQVDHHPNADRLDIIKVLGYSVVTGRDEFKVGDAVIYFPPDMLIPDHVANDMGVGTYLKFAVFPGDAQKTQCRISACRLRGVPSYGFVLGTCTSVAFGADVTAYYSGMKYEPPARVLGGDCLPPDEEFHQYTNIENIRRFSNVFVEGDAVRITEKIHGTNCRLGIIKGELVAGSHKTRRVEGDPRTMYWQPMAIVEPLLRGLYENNLVNGDIIIFGEIFGQGIQDMDYGQSVPSFRAFDISVDGQYLNDSTFRHLCENYDINMVPLLYDGPFSKEIVDELTDGHTTISQETRSKFKGREGIVIKSLFEGTMGGKSGRRKILKSVSVDYHSRKGAKDEG